MEVVEEGGGVRVPAVGQHLGSVPPHGHHQTEGGAGAGQEGERESLDLEGGRLSS